MSANPGNHSIVNKFNGISGPSVLGIAYVGVVRHAGRGIKHNVLQNRARADRMIDLGLFFLGEIDTLGVAATLKIEDPVRPPAMLVIADQAPKRISGEGGFTGS